MKRKRQYKDFDTPQEYLQNVLDTWTEFCYVNCGLAQAISDILKINYALVDAVNVLANELKNRNDR